MWRSANPDGNAGRSPDKLFKEILRVCIASGISGMGPVKWLLKRLKKVIVVLIGGMVPATSKVLLTSIYHRVGGITVIKDKSPPIVLPGTANVSKLKGIADPLINPVKPKLSQWISDTTCIVKAGP